MTHHLKTVNPYFEKCWQQSKTFEVRENDRDFQKGDTVYLQEYDVETNTYSGREIRCTILYVLHEYPAIQKDYVVFSFCIDKQIEANQNYIGHLEKEVVKRVNELIQRDKEIASLKPLK